MESADLRDVSAELAQVGESADDDGDRDALRVLGDAISVGAITNSTAVAIGRNIRQVVNKFELSADAVAALVDLRLAAAASFGIEASCYRYGALLAEKARGFVGRRHLFSAIEEFIAGNSSGYVVVKGGPGFGKTALIAEYVRRTGCLVHINSRGLGVTGTTQFIESIAAQLVADLGLPGGSLPELATHDGSFLLQLLEQASSRLSPGDRLVIAVDALDEVERSNRDGQTNILFLPPVLPANVFFVMTTRDVDIPLVVQTPIRILDVNDYSQQNTADIEEYLRAALIRPRLQSWVSSRSLTGEQFVSALAAASESNFMYLFHVLPEMESGAYSGLDLGQLPVGLVGYYDDHWKRMGMVVKPLPRLKLRLIYILSEACKPVSRQLISDLATDQALTADELDVQEVLDEWRQFLLEDHFEDRPRYSIYHSSFRDFLHRKDIVQAAGITLEGINRLMADNLWASVFDS